jgi:hypothetical protein
MLMLVLVLGVMGMLRLLWWSRRQSLLEHFAHTSEIGVTPPHGIAACWSWLVRSAKWITAPVGVSIAGTETTCVGIAVLVDRAVSSVGFARAG